MPYTETRDNNKVRDIALSIIAGTLLVGTTLFGVTQCSGNKCDKEEPCDKKQKIEIVNDNKVVVDGGKADVSSKSQVVVGDGIVVKNKNEVVVRGNKKDTVYVVVPPKPQPKPKKVVVNDTVRNKVIVNDTVRNVVPQDTAKVVKKPTIAWGYACSIGGCNQR
jgi:hypothetical protein